MKKKKLLIFHQGLAPYRVDLWNSLNDLYEMRIYFAFDHVITQKFDQEALKQKLNLKVNYIKTGFNLFQRAFRWGFLPIIKSFEPDVVISQEFSQTTLFLYLIKRIFKFNYRLFTLTDDSIQIASNSAAIRKAFRNFLAPRLDGIVFVNEEVALWHEKKYNLQGKSIVFPIIHDDAIFRKRLELALPVSNSLIKQHNLTDTKCCFYFGRLVPVKGLDRLLLAFSKIVQDFPEARIVLVGSGDQQKPLEALALKLGINQKVLFAGRWDGIELDAWFNLAPLMVLPSHHEQFGAVVNELLLSGADVLCSTYAGAFQLIKPGVNGDVFDPYDIETLSSLLRKYFSKIPPMESMDTVKPSKMLTNYSVHLRTLHKGFSNNENEDSFAAADIVLR